MPASVVLTSELARTTCQLSREIRRPIGLLITRRGIVDQVLIGAACVPTFESLARFRVGPHSLRGLRLIRTDLHEEPLTQEDLTQLALLRLDLIGSLGTNEDGEPTLLHLAHLLPLNPQGQVCQIMKPVPFHQLNFPFDVFIQSLDSELLRAETTHTVGGQAEAAILISASPKSRGEQEEHLEELQELAESAGVRVLDRMVQRTHEDYQRFLLGKGKLKEVVVRALQQGADLLIFDQDLAPAQARAIAEVTDLKVIDRTQLILDIFARRAHTREGKVQVELAQLRYLLPRLSGHGTSLSRLGGGIGTRGPGETKLETDRRRIRDRIAHLERELERFARHQDQRRARRVRQALPILSIVGYTNAGKSTLLNALTHSRVAAQDRLFDTLDTTSRRLRFPEDRELIVTDTVGFIRDLPKDLVGAFRTTLEELRDADLLLHVVDASAQDIDLQISAVESVLRSLDLEHLPKVLVLNKCDRLSPHERLVLCQRYRAIGISALQRETLRPLIAHLASLLPAPSTSQDRLGEHEPNSLKLALASHD
ncbi:MAG: GTPase HflX [Nitrospira sp.]|nr:GTPase HflX [Nitrospira sp. NTP2]MCK6493724.1 GTPase HflX [Nitrospira sp.]QOJ33561.1 MAG: GTPase HflX [Nitrospira sp.]